MTNRIAPRRTFTGLMSGTALALVLATEPANAGLGDWWDVFAGVSAAEQARLDREADRALSLEYAGTLRAAHEAVRRALITWGPADSDALVAWLGDNDTLNGFRLPGKGLAATRRELEKLGWPADGIGQAGLRVRWCGNLYLHSFYDTGAIEFERGLTATAIRRHVQQASMQEPGGANGLASRQALAAERAGGEYHAGRILRFWRDPETPNACLTADFATPMPAIATLIITGGARPRISQRRERTDDCPTGEVGEGIFNVIESINGIDRATPVDTITRCREKPDAGQSTSVWQPRNPAQTCIQGARAWFDGIVADHGIVPVVSGSFIERRRAWTYTEEFPEDWNMNDLEITWEDDWEVQSNSCRADFTLSEDSHGCPSGQTGTRHLTRTVVYVDYADPGQADPDPVPSPWQTVSDTCRIVTASNNNGGGNNGGGGDSNTHSFDVDGDGRGDYSSYSEAEREHPDANIHRVREDCGRCDGPDNDNSGNDDDSDSGNNDAGGGCFLTTAIVERRGEADDGPTLTALRAFRDGWLATRPEGPALIRQYYDTAPAIVATIPADHPEWDRIAAEVDEAVACLETDDPDGAFAVYAAMVRRLTDDWLIQDRRNA